MRAISSLSEELCTKEQKARSAYKRKIWFTIFLSSIFLPVIGFFFAAVFINFLAIKYKRLSSREATIFGTFIYGAFYVLPQHWANSSSEIVRKLVPVASFCVLAFTIYSIFRLPKNISKLAGLEIGATILNEEKKCNHPLSFIVAPLLAIRCFWKDCFIAANTQHNTSIIARAEALRLVLQHAKTLITKCEQATYRDSYGEVKFDAAAKEIDYFINTVVRNNLFSAPLPRHFSRQHYKKFLSAKLRKASFINNFLQDVIYRLFNAYTVLDFDIAMHSIATQYAKYLHTERYSKESLRFLLGDDYKTLHKLARSLPNKTKPARRDIELIINTLISPSELWNLRKWFVERNSRTLSLNEIETGHEFEVFCQRQLQELGWHAETTRATGDFGADLVVERNGTTIIVQCKYYSKPVGVKAVQEAFAAMKFYNAHRAAVVSNQSYTKNAQQMAEMNNVALLHVNELDML